MTTTVSATEFAEHYDDAGALRFARGLRGLSQQQLAERAGVSRSYVSRLERGKAPSSYSWVSCEHCGRRDSVMLYPARAVWNIAMGVDEERAS